MQIYFFIIHLTHVTVWESLGKPCSCAQFINFTTSHARIRISYYKSYSLHLNVHNEIEGSYDRTIVTIVPNYTGTHVLPLALLLVLHTCNYTDGLVLHTCNNTDGLVLRTCNNTDGNQS